MLLNFLACWNCGQFVHVLHHHDGRYFVYLLCVVLCDTHGINRLIDVVLSVLYHIGKIITRVLVGHGDWFVLLVGALGTMHLIKTIITGVVHLYVVVEVWVLVEVDAAASWDISSYELRLNTLRWLMLGAGPFEVVLPCIFALKHICLFHHCLIWHISCDTRVLPHRI